MKIRDLLENKENALQVTINGWIRTKRESSNVSFISVNDGSTITNIQIVIEGALLKSDILKDLTTGSCVSVEGQLVSSKGSEQEVEVVAKSIYLLGKADPEEYPLQPKNHSLEFLREKAHLRFRTNTFCFLYSNIT